MIRLPPLARWTESTETTSPSPVHSGKARLGNQAGRWCQSVMVPVILLVSSVVLLMVTVAPV